MAESKWREVASFTVLGDPPMYAERLAAGREWASLVVGCDGAPLRGLVKVAVVLYLESPMDPRMLSDCAAPVLDALRGAGWWEDDAQVVSLSMHRSQAPAGKKPATVIMLWEAGDDR